jgi:hypothetical protein
MLNSATTWHRRFWLVLEWQFAVANDAFDFREAALVIPVFLEFLNE